MDQNTKQQIFSVSREDLFFDFRQTFDGVFLFAPFRKDTPNSDQGIRHQEGIGYDFQNNSSPIVKLLPIKDKLASDLQLKPENLVYNIILEDIGLSIRKLIYSIPVKDITIPTVKEINLTEHNDLSFNRGFEVKCFVSMHNDVSEENHVIWNKSHTIDMSSFIVNTSTDKAFFNITWVNFNDEQDQKDLFYFIDWKSTDVSTDIDVDCFEVKANANLKEQFKKLENNPQFGEFCITMIADQILRELMIQCFRFAKLDEAPQKDSLHDKLDHYLSKFGDDFFELAEEFKNSEQNDQLDASMSIAKIIQKNTRLGSALDNINFSKKK